jgi:flagellar biogenesis protein FliO
MRAAWVILMLVLPACVALAQGEPSAFEQRPFPTSSPLVAGEMRAPPASPSMMPDLGRLVAATAIVVALILLARKVFGRFVQTPGQASGAVKIVSRTLIAPRQQIVLVQIGRRVVALSDSAGRVTPICEISDADEVAGLLGRTVEPTASFDSELSAAESRLAPTEPVLPARTRIDRPVGQSLDRVDEDLKSLIARVKGITRDMNP